jgi:hypothetical protein
MLKRQTWPAVLLVLLCALSTISGEEMGLEVATLEKTECNPLCKWECTEPECPPVCKPVCARPRCENRCVQLPCSKCQLHCSKPMCTVRCPKVMCAKDRCPTCVTSCEPAKCYSTCEEPAPTCRAVCEPTRCDWKCRKPDNCPKKKCQLNCEKPECAETKTKEQLEKQNCCGCKEEFAVQAAIRRANANDDDNASSDEESSVDMKPSFLEVMSHMYMREQVGLQSMCCPCNFG